MKILVTGGCGFIGSHLVEGLLREGHEVAILDDFNDFYDPRLKEANLETIRYAGQPELYRADIRDEEAVERAFAETKPEAVIHLAARAGIRASLVEPLLYEQVNCGGTILLLEASRRHAVRRFVFASSSSVYGLTDRVPFRETDAALLPISPYAASKIAGEKYCFTYSHLYGLSVACLRLFTVYGPRQRPDLAIRKFIGLIAADREIPFFGGGSTGRDYTHVSDIVAGIGAALLDTRPFEIYNLGNSSPVTLSEMVATIERAFNKRARLKHSPLPPGDMSLTCADIGKARAELGYRPQVEFGKGIEDMVGWFRATRAGRASA